MNVEDSAADLALSNLEHLLFAHRSRRRCSLRADVLMEGVDGHFTHGRSADFLRDVRQAEFTFERGDRRRVEHSLANLGPRCIVDR